MKITKISVKNFKSIDSLDNFEINDDKICCFIGKNGSGKSNILLALNALKSDNDLINENRYEKAKKDEQIEIHATVVFDSKDSVILEPFGLSTSIIAGFTISVVKPVGEEPPIRSFDALEFVDKTESKIVTKLVKVRAVLNKLTVAPDNEQKKLETVGNIKYDKSLPNELVVSMNSALTFLESSNPSEEIKSEFNSLIEEIDNLVKFDIREVIEKRIWPKLSINLLDPYTYTIENVSSRVELNDGSVHPFLFDLLSLSGKKPENLDVSGSELVNVFSDISKELTAKLGKVWTSHPMAIEISRQANNIIFMFKTPQDRSLELRNLSVGQQWFLRFYTALARSKENDQQVIWLFDEPGQTLHAASQIDLKEYFETISESSQIFYSTHQPMMIPWHRLERIFLVENSNSKGTNIPDRLWKDGDLESPLKEALALFIGEEMLTGKEHILVEGPVDYILLQGWSRFFQNTTDEIMKWKRFSVSNRTFVPAGGRDQMPLYLLFLTHRTKNIVSAVAVPDTSADEDRVKEGIGKQGLDPLTHNVVSFETILKDEKLNIKGIEDLFEIDEYLNEVVSFYNSKYPDVKIPKDFTKPKKPLENGICSYVLSSFRAENPEIFSNDKIGIDKPGIALSIYRKLIHSEKNPYSDKTKKRFSKILGKLDSKLIKTNSGN